MAALQQSVNKARAARGKSDTDVHELPARAVKKATAEQTAKSPARKTSSMKPRHSV
ncbi:hypothetical protein [Streptomyces mirabilis]|uniref:hypothetical protein n=1 Tax=Streptomyces mirabilis TaxID=68239 RepID=UPI0036695565